MKIYKTENGNILKVNRPVKLLVDNETKSVSSVEEITVNNCDDIRVINEQKVVCRYENHKGDARGVEDYKEEYNRLSGQENLDTEYQFKKLLQDWSPIYKTIQEISEPLKIEIISTRLDTGNKYINSLWCEGGSNPTIFRYNREKAQIDTLVKQMIELGVEDTDNTMASTVGKKYYISGHSGIRFANAFGRYLFKDGIDHPKDMRGSLESMKSKCNEDIAYIKKTIKDAYNVAFGELTDDNIKGKVAIRSAEDAFRLIDNVEPKRKSESDYYKAKKKIVECITKFKELYEVKEDELPKD